MAADITQMLLDAQGGNKEAVDSLYQEVYAELRRVARAQLRLSPGDTLRTTALVHEAYLKLFDQTRVGLKDRNHFFALSARAMRQILVDHFRSGRAGKRGGGSAPLELKDGEVPVGARSEILLALDEALQRLALLNKRLSQVVEYKFFGGLTQDQIADTLGLSERTVRSDWLKAKAWLARELEAAG